MFPQLGPPISFIIATGLFLALLVGFGEAAFVASAWRAPFLVSAVLVAIGLYVRASLEETPAFKALEHEKRVAATAVGLAMPALMSAGMVGVFIFLALALGVMGLTFAPLGGAVPELFPVPVRYTGAASAYNPGGILGASFAPSLAQILEAKGGVAWSAITSPWRGRSVSSRC
jgi:hypothetical protein